MLHKSMEDQRITFAQVRAQCEYYTLPKQLLHALWFSFVAELKWNNYTSICLIYTALTLECHSTEDTKLLCLLAGN